MPSSPPYQLLADIVLLLHLATVLFVIGGLVAIVIGNLRNWRWVNGLTFRITHLVVIAIVVAQAWLGRLCPLTILENWLREQAGQASYRGSFIQHWVETVLYYDAPAWVFTLAYTGFALLVLVAWLCFPLNSKPADDRKRQTVRGS